MRASWDAAREDFAVDGSLRDIYVRPADLEAWQRVFAGLLHSGKELSLEVNGVTHAVPRQVEELFALTQRAAIVLRVQWRAMQLNCHFFDPMEIEFDLDPREVHDQQSFEAVAEFLESLARWTGTRVTLTAENAPDAVILSALPNGDVRWHPASEAV